MGCLECGKMLQGSYYTEQGKWMGIKVLEHYEYNGECYCPACWPKVQKTKERLEALPRKGMTDAEANAAHEFGGEPL